MVPKTCSIEGCAKPARTRGWCTMHYTRWKRHGDTSVSTNAPLPQRFWAKVNRREAGACWDWTASLSAQGYGQLAVKINGKRTVTTAHRISYSLHFGPIPDGKHVDHRCRNRRCVNPSHLRLVTPGQNNQNHSGARRDSATGVRGVSWHAAYGRYVACVQHQGTSHHVGYFDTLAEAEAAVIAKRNELHTHNDIDRLPRTA